MNDEQAQVISDAITCSFATEYGTIVDAVVDGFQHGGPNGDVSMIDTFIDLAYRAKQIAAAITPVVAGNTDASGGHVESLTEAVMGVTAGLVQIANAIQALAEAVNSKS